jgi:hypothetical protein
MLATNDRHARRAHIEELSDEPRQRLVGATVKRRRGHAHDRDALANGHEFVLPGARLYSDRDVRAGHAHIFAPPGSTRGVISGAIEAVRDHDGRAFVGGVGGAEGRHHAGPVSTSRRRVGNE